MCTTRKTFPSLPDIYALRDLPISAILRLHCAFLDRKIAQFSRLHRAGLARFADLRYIKIATFYRSYVLQHHNLQMGWGVTSARARAQAGAIDFYMA